MRLPNPLEPLSNLAEAFYTLNQRLERVEQDQREIIRQISELRTEYSDLKTRIAVLEEGRRTIDAQVRAVIAETIADLRVKFIESQAARSTSPEFLPPTRDDT